MVYIHGAIVYTPQARIDGGAVLMADGRIVAVGPVETVVCPPEARRVDAGNGVLVPGFIDLQLNGAFGQDLTVNSQQSLVFSRQSPVGSRQSAIWEVARQLPRYGVTAFLPTIITSPLATVSGAMRALAAGAPEGFRGATPLGLHVEGPFLNPGKKGAHDAAFLRSPATADVAGWSREQGVWLVTLAPELPGAPALIRELDERGVVVSAGHSLATYDEAIEGFATGVRYGTHLFNAMPALQHREPGLAGALLADERVTVGLIADGIHVHPALVELVWRLLGSERLNLVTDAMAALGMPPGRYQLGEATVTVDETGARLADGTLAGSVLSLDAALRNLIAYTGCSLEAALPTVTTTPARLLGLGGSKGQIAPGFDADMVLLTADLKVSMTFVAGEVVYSEPRGTRHDEQ